MQDGCYCPRPLEDRCIKGNPLHECSWSKQIPLCCVDEDGKFILHGWNYQPVAYLYLLTGRVRAPHCAVRCDCEPVPVTMTCVGIWPASPQFPQLAFTFWLLDWVEAPTLECQVAL